MSSESLIPEEEIKKFRKENYRLIFCIGLPGSGKESQIEKVSNEFKYGRINLKTVLLEEEKSESDIGKEIKKSKEEKQPIKSEIMVYLLIRSCLSQKQKTILIDEFPYRLEDALYFEQNVAPIELILKFTGTDDICLKNLNEDPNYIVNLEYLKEKFSEVNKNIQIIDDFYSPYAIIREIDISKTIDEINIQMKQSIYPIIYSIIGKRYSGKTELGKVLHERMNLKLIDFNEFLSSPELKNKKNENEYVVNKFILLLRDIRDTRVLIEDFPQNKEQYNYFINNCKEFQKIIYLDADNCSCLERLNKIPLNDPNYTDSAALNKLLYEFENKKDFHEYLMTKAKIQKIDVNNHKVLTIKDMMKQLQPFCAYIETQNDTSGKEELFNKLRTKYEFKEILLSKIIEKGISRKLINKQDEYTVEDKINLIRPILFNEKYHKILLNSFPTNMTEFNELGMNLCYVSKYIILSEYHNLPTINNVDSMSVFCYKRNILGILNPKNISDYKIEECLNMTRDINIVYGLPQSGKSTIAKYLKNKFNFELLDFKELTEKIKKTKVDPENPDAEPEINFNDLLTGLKKYFDETPLNRKIIVDNIFIPGGPDGFLIDTYNKALEVLNIIPNFKNFYEICISEKELLNKYKAKEGITEEMTDEQKTAFEETLEQPKKLLENIREKSANVIRIKTDSEEGTYKFLESLYNINFILLKHEYDICLEKSLDLFAARNKILYINVPKLLYNQFYYNTQYAKPLESWYGKKKLKIECKDKDNLDEMIYYKYNPMNFEKELVMKIINNYITSNSKIIEENGNFVLLSGFLNSDLLENENEPYNLPLLELKSIINLGDITTFIQLTRTEIKQEEDEKAEQIVIEKPVKKVIKKNEDGTEEEVQGEEQPPEEENPDGVPKFKPENFAWTYYDGVPRNYVQILKRLKMFPIKVIESNDTCREELIKVLGNHLDNFANKEELQYKGIITIIKINAEVPKETTEDVNKVSKFVEGRREADGLNKGKKSKDKGGAGYIYEIL